MAGGHYLGIKGDDIVLNGKPILLKGKSAGELRAGDRLELRSADSQEPGWEVGVSWRNDQLG